MKHLITTLILLTVTAITLSAQDTFKALSEMKGVETVYISEAMINMSSNANKSDKSGRTTIGGVRVNNTSLRHIKNMEIYSCEKQPAVEKARQVYAEYKKAHPQAQILVRVKDDDDITEIMALPGTAPVAYCTLIIYNAEPKEVNIIVINGNFSSNDITTMSKGHY
ncbi:MAG: DUF4252 domain-containing protein [Paramuribaculum sp.]|nr:DUF4252 domain-containing protein [Paramuribaculum sp.]